jgi:hypothetical protein
MEAIRQGTIIVDLNSKNYDTKKLKQGDTTELTFYINYNGIATNLSGNSFSLIFNKPDNTVVQQVTGFNTSQASTGILKVNLLPDCVRAVGYGSVEIEIKKDGNRISSFMIPIEVEPTGLENLPSEDKKLFLEEVEQIKEDYINATNTNIIQPVKRVFTATTNNTTTFTLELGLYNKLVDVLQLRYQGEILEEDENYTYDEANRVVTLGWGLSIGEKINITVIKGISS